MRYWIVFIFFFISCFRVNSQDTIHFRDGAVRIAKVTEVGVSEIKYYNFDALNGPIRSSNKNNIWYIKYKAGFVDSVSQTTLVENNVTSEKLRINGYSLLYCERYIDDRQFLSMINETKDEAKKQVMQYEFNVMRIYSKRRNNFGALGGVSLAAALIEPLFFYFGNMPNAAISVGVIFGSIAITSTVFAGLNKNNYRAQRVKIAQLYNTYN